MCPHRLTRLGRRPFTAKIGVQIPLGTPTLHSKVGYPAFAYPGLPAWQAMADTAPSLNEIH